MRIIQGAKRKLSDAIRIGAKRTRFHLGWYTKEWGSGRVATCVLGAAIIGEILGEDGDLSTSDFAFSGDTIGRLWPELVEYNSELRDRVAKAVGAKVGVDRCATAADVLMYNNDYRSAPREVVADQLEKIGL